MNISASEVKDNKLTAEITIPAAEVTAAVKAAYKECANKYRFEGFRKGRAPRQVIDAMIGAEYVRAEATNTVLEANEAAVLNELDIVPVNAEYKAEPVEDGKDYVYSIEFSLRPAAELTSYDEVAINMPPAEATEGEINAQIEMLMGYHTEFKETEEGYEAANNDVCQLTIVNVENAEKIEGQQTIILGRENNGAEVNEALVGMKAGETKDVSWKASDAEDAADVKVTITLDSVKQQIVPELTDEFASENFGFESVAAMRDAVKIEVENDKKTQLPTLKENRCVAELAGRLELEEIDEEYVKTVYGDLGQSFWNNLQRQGMTFDAWLNMSHITAAQFYEDLFNQANDVARETIAIDALAKHLAVEVTDEDINNEFAQAGVEETEIESLKAEFVKDGRMPSVRDSVRRSKAVEWLVENAKVTEVDEYAADAE